ncbi:MAG: hypothetical protein IKB57_06590 [Bacteroidaceae bacterium]|nr:hypothetical protein [Bacteroidaceae bacterium]
MKTSEMVLEFLRKEGFCPDVDPDNGNIIFKYQMRTFLFPNNDEDEEFFQLIMPAICDVTDDNRDIMLEAANKTNLGMKVAKAGVFDDSVWLFFEVILDESPEVGSIIRRGLGILQNTQQNFYEQLS